MLMRMDVNGINLLVQMQHCGHLECLKYAHENGCEWDRYTCSNAAFNGHLECLKYAHTDVHGIVNTCSHGSTEWTLRMSKICSRKWMSMG
jgi:hypothetical protein